MQERKRGELGACLTLLNGRQHRGRRAAAVGERVADTHLASGMATIRSLAALTDQAVATESGSEPGVILSCRGPLHQQHAPFFSKVLCLKPAMEVVTQLLSVYRPCERILQSMCPCSRRQWCWGRAEHSALKFCAAHAHVTCRDSKAGCLLLMVACAGHAQAGQVCAAGALSGGKARVCPPSSAAENMQDGKTGPRSAQKMSSQHVQALTDLCSGCLFCSFSKLG